MNFDPATTQAGAANNALPGSVIVDLGSNTGVRASFKLDNGTLTFDFTAHKMSSTDQQTIAGQVEVKGETKVLGVVTQQEKETDEEIHFSGQVISSTDENGNRVFTLQGKITDQGDGALVLNNMQGFQSEQSTAEIDVDAKLTVSRETVVNGDTTTTKSSAAAEMNLNRVENTVDEGVNVKTITPLNTSDGFNAGLVANNGALQFNFGVFNVGLRFSA